MEHPARQTTIARQIDPILRAGLTVAFLYFGLTKLLGIAGTVALYDAIGFGQFPRYITGSIETLGAIGLWLPRIRGLAALVLAATMVVGLSAMLIFVGDAWWHIAVLLGLSGVAAWFNRQDILHLIPRRRSA